jgi:hypothetical protein
MPLFFVGEPEAEPKMISDIKMQGAAKIAMGNGCKNGSLGGAGITSGWGNICSVFISVQPSNPLHPGEGPMPALTSLVAISAISISKACP